MTEIVEISEGSSHSSFQKQAEFFTYSLLAAIIFLAVDTKYDGFCSQLLWPAAALIITWHLHRVMFPEKYQNALNKALDQIAALEKGKGYLEEQAQNALHRAKKEEQRRRDAEEDSYSKINLRVIEAAGHLKEEVAELEEELALAKSSVNILNLQNEKLVEEKKATFRELVVIKEKLAITQASKGEVKALLDVEQKVAKKEKEEFNRVLRDMAYADTKAIRNLEEQLAAATAGENWTRCQKYMPSWEHIRMLRSDIKNVQQEKKTMEGDHKVSIDILKRHHRNELEKLHAQLAAATNTTTTPTTLPSAHTPSLQSNNSELRKELASLKTTILDAFAKTKSTSEPIGVNNMINELQLTVKQLNATIAGMNNVATSPPSPKDGDTSKEEKFEPPAAVVQTITEYKSDPEQESRILELQGQIEKLEAVASEQKIEAEKLVGEAHSLREQVAGLESASTEAEKVKETLSVQLTAAGKEVTDLQAIIAAAKEEKNQADLRLNEVTEEVSGLRQQLRSSDEKSSRTSERYESHCNGLNSQIAEKDKEILETSQMANQLRIDLDSLRSEWEVKQQAAWQAGWNQGMADQMQHDEQKFQFWANKITTDYGNWQEGGGTRNLIAQLQQLTKDLQDKTSREEKLEEHIRMLEGGAGGQAQDQLMQQLLAVQTALNQKADEANTAQEEKKAMVARIAEVEHRRDEAIKESEWQQKEGQIVEDQLWTLQQKYDQLQEKLRLISPTQQFALTTAVTSTSANPSSDTAMEADEAPQSGSPPEDTNMGVDAAPQSDSPPEDTNMGVDAAPQSESHPEDTNMGVDTAPQSDSPPQDTDMNTEETPPNNPPAPTIFDLISERLGETGESSGTQSKQAKATENKPRTIVGPPPSKGSTLPRSSIVMPVFSKPPASAVQEGAEMPPRPSIIPGYKHEQMKASNTQNGTARAGMAQGAGSSKTAAADFSRAPVNPMSGFGQALSAIAPQMTTLDRTAMNTISKLSSLDGSRKRRSDREEDHPNKR